MKKITLLIVEDEEAIRDMLHFALPKAEFDLIDAENTSIALKILNQRLPDLIVLDWMLPDKSGIDFIKSIKKKDAFTNIPIIMLTAKAEEDNKVKALTIGADDYLTKPFSPKELEARIKAILRRGPVKSPLNEIKIDDLIIDTNKCSVMIRHQVIKLTPSEYKLLHFFMLHPNKTYTRDQLLNHIWGNHAYIQERTIDAQMKRLRMKLKTHKYDQRIKTVRGMGYCFLSEPHEEKK